MTAERSPRASEHALEDAGVIDLDRYVVLVVQLCGNGMQCVSAGSIGVSRGGFFRLRLPRAALETGMRPEFLGGSNCLEHLGGGLLLRS